MRQKLKEEAESTVWVCSVVCQNCLFLLLQISLNNIHVWHNWSFKHQCKCCRTTGGTCTLKQVETWYQTEHSDVWNQTNTKEDRRTNYVCTCVDIERIIISEKTSIIEHNCLRAIQNALPYCNVFWYILNC